MPKEYKTINVHKDLYKELSELADKVKLKEEIRNISLSNLIERMKKVYKEVEQL